MLGQARVVAGPAGATLELVDAIVARVKPQAAGKLIKGLAVDMPMVGLQHLKRVRPGGSSLEVLVCIASAHALQTASNGGTGLSEWVLQRVSEDTAAALADAESVHIVSVPSGPPDTREKWEKWAKIWPMYWRLTGDTLPKDGELAPPAEQAYFERHMSALLAEVRAAGAANVALVIDSATGNTIARGVDRSGGHPLAHAAMLAAAAAAERDLMYWPVNPFEHKGREGKGGGSADTSSGSGSSRASSEGLAVDGQLPHKRQRLVDDAACPCDGGGASVSASADADGCASARTASAAAPPAPNGAAANGNCAAACRSRPLPAGNGTAIAAAAAAAAASVTIPLFGAASTSARAFTAPPGVGDGSFEPSADNKPYLCTGWDCFLLMEPCMMCAMALVHSRLRRVVYCKPDPVHGALGGRHRLHAHRSLNHRYRVYHLPLAGEEAVSDGAGGCGCGAAASPPTCMAAREQPQAALAAGSAQQQQQQQQPHQAAGVAAGAGSAEHAAQQQPLPAAAATGLPQPQGQPPGHGNRHPHQHANPHHHHVHHHHHLDPHPHVHTHHPHHRHRASAPCCVNGRLAPSAPQPAS